MLRAHQKLGLFKQAIDDYLAARKLRPSAELTAAVGYGFNKLGHDAAAITFYQEALAQGGNTVAVLNNLGFSLQQLKRPKESLRWLSEAIRISSKVQAPFVNRAILDLEQVVARQRLCSLAGNGRHSARSSLVQKAAAFLFCRSAFRAGLPARASRLRECWTARLARGSWIRSPCVAKPRGSIDAGGKCPLPGIFQRAKRRDPKYLVERLVPIEP